MQQHKNTCSSNLRRGKWSNEEEAYADKLMNAFKRGLISPNEIEGKTLRCYLAMKLSCLPMRISKKYPHCEGLGARFFHRPDVTEEQMIICETELSDLRTRFLEADHEQRRCQNRIFFTVSKRISSDTNCPIIADSCNKSGEETNSFQDIETSDEDRVLFNFLDSEFMEDTSESYPSNVSQDIRQIPSINQEIYSFSKADSARKTNRDIPGASEETCCSSNLETNPRKRVCYYWEGVNGSYGINPSISYIDQNMTQSWDAAQYQNLDLLSDINESFMSFDWDRNTPPRGLYNQDENAGENI